jgi:hypothetical protein
VNISKEQAVKIAMEYIKNYSYKIAEDVWISDFNVTEDRTVAHLVTTVRESNVLYLYWSITLYLNQTYPGSVTSIALGIWADSGEVRFCRYEAYGGSGLISDSDSGYIVSDGNSDSESSPSPSSSENNGASTGLGMVAIIVVATIVIAVATTTIIFKKRKH